MAELEWQREVDADQVLASFRLRGDLEVHRLLEKLPAAAYTCDSDGLITFYNQQARQLWGRAPKLHDPEDRYCGSFRLWWPDGTPMAHDSCWMAQALKKGREFDGEEVVIERTDGRRLTALAHANPIYSEDGTLVGAVNVLIDITDRKCAEENLKNADRAKDEFLATLAHELRNPLAPIRNALTIMKEAEHDPETVTSARAMIERQVEHMMHVVDDLLDLSRIAGESLRLRKERVELSTVIERAVEACEPFLEDSDHELIVSLPSEPIQLDADPVRLVQVFVNLIDNAAKHSARRGRIWLTATRRQGEVRIVVRDEGKGIPAEMLTKIFEPFAQLDRTLERSHAGLGIGLTLVRRLVELHGGSVEAHSTGSGQGSEFVVCLAIASDERPVDEPRSEDDGQLEAPPRRVLVVDDNRDSATSLATLLELSGHQTRVAHDGEAAVRAAAEFRPDVALLDIAMPKLNGYEAARQIRTRPWGRDIVMIAMSGYGQREDIERSYRSGIDHHLVKPLDVGELDTLLASLAARPLTEA